MPVNAMFTSRRERRLWGWAAVVLLAIYATLPLAGALADLLRRHARLDQGFVVAFVVLVVALTAGGLTKGPGRREIWTAVGVFAVFGMAFVRLGMTERTHLFEYGLLGTLIYQALSERRAGGAGVRFPAAAAVIVTSAIGLADEGVQALLPDRRWDIVDVGFNALAALVVVTATVALEWARRLDLRGRGSDDT